MADQASEAAVLFADVSGSTKLYETAGNAVAHAAVESCVNIMRQKTVAAKGRVIKTIGDEVMAAFRSADDAADAAIEMQLAISQLPPVGNNTLGVRIGFNYGPVVETGGDVFGDAVSLASRLAALATKGQIITARETVMMLSPILKANTRAITTIQVKGRSQEVQVYELMWQQSEDMTTLASHKGVFKPRNTTLRLRMQDMEMVLSAERPSLAMGRDPSADLIIRERMASRAHGKIERRLDKFVLTDHSANGTFVTIEGDKEIVLRREEFTLRGHGWIAFGQSRSGATDVVEFFCE
ncbi:MAG TPA: adenylate/guanylate cyclase domain-containing protein [Burkholderiales bacterium]|nr:adenylate/guanylate cyclase domain-containing protein [Burkholderiales bacterium]